MFLFTKPGTPTSICFFTHSHEISPYLCMGDGHAPRILQIPTLSLMKGFFPKFVNLFI